MGAGDKGNYNIGGEIRHVRGATTDKVITARLDTDQTVNRFEALADGKLQWGAGTASAVDTNLYRSGANALKTDDAFTAAAGLTVTTGGLLVSAGGATITAGGLTVTAGGATITAGGLLVTAGGITVTAGGQTYTAGDVALSDGVLTQAKSIATADTGTVRGIIGSVTATHAAQTAGTLCGVRGLYTLDGGSGIASGPIYGYGTQGKAVLDGRTIAAGSGHICGVMAQMSANGTTVTNGHVATLICSGQNLPTSANVDMIYAESGNGKVNSILKANVKCDYFLDITDFESCGVVDAEAHGSTARGRIKVKVPAGVGYIHVFSD